MSRPTGAAMQCMQCMLFWATLAEWKWNVHDLSQSESITWLWQHLRLLIIISASSCYAIDCVVFYWQFCLFSAELLHLDYQWPGEKSPSLDCGHIWDCSLVGSFYPCLHQQIKSVLKWKVQKSELCFTLVKPPRPLGKAYESNWGWHIGQVGFLSIVATWIAVSTTGQNELDFSSCKKEWTVCAAHPMGPDQTKFVKSIYLSR